MKSKGFQSFTPHRRISWRVGLAFVWLFFSVGAAAEPDGAMGISSEFRPDDSSAPAAGPTTMGDPAGAAQEEVVPPSVAILLKNIAIAFRQKSLSFSEEDRTRFDILHQSLDIARRGCAAKAGAQANICLERIYRYFLNYIQQMNVTDLRNTLILNDQPPSPMCINIFMEASIDSDANALWQSYRQCLGQASIFLMTSEGLEYVAVHTQEGKEIPYVYRLKTLQFSPRVYAVMRFVYAQGVLVDSRAGVLVGQPNSITYYPIVEANEGNWDRTALNIERKAGILEVTMKVSPSLLISYIISHTFGNVDTNHVDWLSDIGCRNCKAGTLRVQYEPSEDGVRFRAETVTPSAGAFLREQTQPLSSQQMCLFRFLETYDDRSLELSALSHLGRMMADQCPVR